jgi:undecaprenyl-diphosphatase
MDLSLLETLNDFARGHDRFEDAWRFLAEVAPYLFVALLAGLFFMRGRWRSVSARHGVVAAGFSAVLALGVAQVISSIWDRPRPYVAHPDDVHLFVSPSSDPSFPSDHATAAFAIAVAILLRDRRAGLVALAMAVAVSVSRVVVGIHYPSDVAGGALIGTLAALVFWLPQIRRPLHAFADWLGAVYERVAVAVRGALPARSSAR